MKHKPSGKNTNCLENMICPDCGNEDELHIDVTTTVVMIDDGSVKHGDLDYDQTSICYCPKCKADGTVGDFAGE